MFMIHLHNYCLSVYKDPSISVSIDCMNYIDIINNGAAGGSSAASANQQLSVFDVNKKIHEVIALYAYKVRDSEVQGPFNKWTNPALPLSSCSVDWINQLENRERIVIECTRSSVAVTRKDAPQFTNEEDGTVTPRNKRYVMMLYASSPIIMQAFQSLPLIFAGNELSEFIDGLVFEGYRISISMDVSSWEYVPSVVAAFLEAAV